MSELEGDDDTLLMVVSDHGFCSFQRGVNLNAWLRDEGYLVLKDGAETSDDWFEKVDWEKTKAFTLGLTGIFINRKGRERVGQVEPGEELDSLCKEIKEKLCLGVLRAHGADPNEAPCISDLGSSAQDLLTIKGANLTHDSFSS